MAATGARAGPVRRRCLQLELILDSGGDHQLLPGRHDLDREVAGEAQAPGDRVPNVGPVLSNPTGERKDCLLYTSDAADE